jgi:hypothetical protein
MREPANCPLACPFAPSRARWNSVGAPSTWLLDRPPVVLFARQPLSVAGAPVRNNPAPVAWRRGAGQRPSPNPSPPGRATGRPPGARRRRRFHRSTGSPLSRTRRAFRCLGAVAGGRAGASWGSPGRVRRWVTATVGKSRPVRVRRGRRGRGVSAPGDSYPAPAPGRRGGPPRRRGSRGPRATTVQSAQVPVGPPGVRRQVTVIGVAGLRPCATLDLGCRSRVHPRSRRGGPRAPEGLSSPRGQAVTAPPRRPLEGRWKQSDAPGQVPRQAWTRGGQPCLAASRVAPPSGRPGGHRRLAGGRHPTITSPAPGAARPGSSARRLAVAAPFGSPGPGAGDEVPATPATKERGNGTSDTKRKGRTHSLYRSRMNHRPWARQESNLRPKDYESPALTTELRARYRVTRWSPVGHLLELGAPGVGLEPTTNGLTGRCSAD